MCYHISLTKEEKSIEAYSGAVYNTSNVHQPYFNLDAIKSVFKDYEPNHLSIIKQDDPEIIDLAIWQLLPTNYDLSLRKEFWKKYKTLNATSETLFSSSLYNKFIKWQKCIIFADGFFEPHTSFNNEKIPHYIKEESGSLFGFAGIYSVIDDNPSAPIYSTTIITKEANTFFKEIHNTPNNKGSFRMPLILDPSDYWDWLHTSDENEIKTLLHTFTKQEFKAYSVSRDLYKRNINTNIPDILNEVPFNKGLF